MRLFVIETFLDGTRIAAQSLILHANQRALYELKRIISTNTHMDAERTIADIEWLERLITLPDVRPMSVSDREAANRRHDQMCASNPWFKVWQQFGLPR